jgi:hypothetical protein
MKLDVITRSINQSILKTKKNSPHIFFGAGIIASITSTVLACRATLKLEDVLEEIEHKFDVIDMVNPPDAERNPLVWEARFHGVKELVKLYGPTVLTEIVAIGLLSGSHVQMSKKNGALMAALVAISKGHENYREKVAEEVGEDKEIEIHHEVSLVDKSEWNAFTRIFDETCQSYHKDVELNRQFLHFCQSRANVMLRTKGVVFLNDVYDMLGYERTREGHVYGWVYGGDGLNEIDFGIFDATNSRFINGLERAVILNFNVDGPLHDYI